MKRYFPYVLLVASLSLAFSAAYYSVFGLSRLFSSQFLAVTILAGTLEASKLITASYLHRAWNNISRLIKIYLTTAVIILMCVTSLGIYGFLVSAYQDTAYKLNNLEITIKNIESKRSRFQTQLDAVINDKLLVNTNIQQLTQALSTNQQQRVDRNGNLITSSSSGNRKAYEKQLEFSMQRLNELSNKESILSDSVTKMETSITELQTSSDVAAEIGPLKYIAKIVGSDMDTVVNWLIIALIIVFDPLAVLLLISANKEFLKQPKIEEIQDISLEKPLPKPEPKPEPKPQPQILSYWNKLRDERSKKYKK